jgi:hypothetical protein
MALCVAFGPFAAACFGNTSSNNGAAPRDGGSVQDASVVGLDGSVAGTDGSTARAEGGAPESGSPEASTAMGGCDAAGAGASVDGGNGVAITVPDLGGGFNYYQGSYSLGWSFVANSAIKVTQLGFYDAAVVMDGGAQNEPAQSHPVGIYDMATKALLGSVTVSTSDPLVGFFHYASLAQPVSLTSCNTYVIMSNVGTESYLAFYNIEPSWTVSPAITYVGSAVNYANASGTALLYPDTFTPSAGDFGPDFQFTGP